MRFPTGGFPLAAGSSSNIYSIYTGIYIYIYGIIYLENRSAKISPFDDLLDEDESDDGQESASPRDSEKSTASEKRSVDDVVPQSDQFPAQTDDGEQYIFFSVFFELFLDQKKKRIFFFGGKAKEQGRTSGQRPAGVSLRFFVV